MIDLECPSCGKHLSISDRFAGKGGTCKGCGEWITVPGAVQILAPAVTEREPLPTIKIDIPRRGSSLGIASMVLGIVALPFSMIPILGYVGVPLALIGATLAALGFIASMTRSGAGVGFPIAGMSLCVLALAITAFWTYAITEATLGLAEFATELAEDLDEPTSTIPDIQEALIIPDQEEQDEIVMKPFVESTDGVKAKRYIRDYLYIENFRVAQGKEQFSDKRKPSIFGTLVNSGNATLNHVAMKIYFFDAANNVIGEHDVQIHSTTSYLDPDTPMRPGYRHDFGFIIGDVAPSSWSGYVEYELTKIGFK